MTYKEKQENIARGLLKSYFNDEGYGVYVARNNNKKDFMPCELILKSPDFNLHESIREEALDYFRENKIVWWNTENHPSGHLLSSQISCLNHLFFFKNDKSAATAFLKNLDKSISEALIVDTFYIEFEKVGIKTLGGEKNLTRGAYCTSIDALMLGKNDKGKIIVFIIEWKFTESFSADSVLKDDGAMSRWMQYYSLLTSPDCPLITNKFNIEVYYTSTFYQMMRQTLFANEFIKRKEYGAEDYLVVNVIPENNFELRNIKDVPLLKTEFKDLESVWKSFLKSPNKFMITSPKNFISPAYSLSYAKELTDYLDMRYHK